MNKNSLVYTIIFSFIATFILIFPLALANNATKPIVEKNTELSNARGILSSLDIDYSKLTQDEILADFDALQAYELSDGSLKALSPQEAKEKRSQELLFYKAETPEGLRYAGIFQGPGLWGSITLALGFSEDLSTFAGFKVLAQSETPGLGARISESWFEDQFKGQKVPENAQLLFKQGDGSGDKDKSNDAVDAVTGATLTSNGVRDIVNKAIAQMKNLIKGGL